MKKFLSLTLAVLLLLCCFTGCGNTKDDTVMTVNGQKIGWDEYTFWIGYASMYLSYQYSMYGSEVEWLLEGADGTTNAQWCVEYATETVTQKGVIEAKCAEMGIALSEEEMEEVQKSIDDYKVQCCGEDATDEQFESYLKTNQYSNLAVIRSTQITSVLSNKLFEALYGTDGSNYTDEELLTMAAEKGYTKANHILYLFTDEEGEVRSDAQVAAGKAKLEGFMAELNAIEDSEARYERFLELKEENCEDGGTEAYQFGQGVMVEEFYDASIALEPYELTITETDYGYHLMIGLPLELEYEVSTGNGYTALKEVILGEIFGNDLQAWTEEATVEYAKGFEDFDFSTMFTEGGYSYESWAERSAKK